MQEEHLPAEVELVVQIAGETLGHKLILMMWTTEKTWQVEGEQDREQILTMQRIEFHQYEIKVDTFSKEVVLK